MYHTASLFHDDVIDHATSRRGRDAVNQVWGEKSAIAAGDYAMAISNKILAEIGDPEVVRSMSSIIHCLVLGEFQQMSPNSKEGKRLRLANHLDSYLEKTFNKTASLMAYSSQAVAQLAVVAAADAEHISSSSSSSSNDSWLIRQSYLYGKNLGIGFQLMDDLLDFEASEEELGKPAAGADLK